MNDHNALKQHLPEVSYAASHGTRSRPGTTRRSLLLGAAACLGAFASAAGLAKSYPSRPVRFIAPYAPGTGPEVVLRLIAEPLGQRLGQPVVVENKLGASGILAMQDLMRAPADGHSFVLGDIGTLAINPHLHNKLPYDPDKDLKIVTELLSVPWAFFVPKKSDIKTFEQFVAAARARPGELTYGSTGRGSPTSIVIGLLKEKLGLDLREIPHGGGTAVYTNVVAGRIDFMTASLASSKSFHDRLTPLAISSSERDRNFPGMPTLAEATGIAGFEIDAWSFVMARAETPDPIVQRIREELTAVLAMPVIRQRLVEMGMTPGRSSDPTVLKRLMERDSRSFAEVVKLEKLEKQ